MNKIKSQRGIKGTVGAPAKPVRFPKVKFTVKRAVAMNPNVCELTVRTAIKEALVVGELVNVGKVPQPKKAAGRPQFAFILKELVGNLTVKPTKTPKVAKVKAVKVPKAEKPEVVPTVTVVAVAPEVVAPTPVVVTAPVESVAAPVVLPLP